tara:strand:+ start:1819 stop:2289 length:471 start_codon:yes stop_codon:yes gene_type:complete
MKNLLIITFISIYTIGYSQISVIGKVYNSDRMQIEIYANGSTTVNQVVGDSYSFNLRENTVYNMRFISLDSISNGDNYGVPSAKLVHITTGSGKPPYDNQFDIPIDFSEDTHYSFFWKEEHKVYSLVTYERLSFSESYRKYSLSPLLKGQDYIMNW